jgi:membrane protein
VKLEVVLFDIDGTLIDSNEQHVNAWAFAFRDAGHAQELDDIRAQIGKGGDLLVPALLPDVGEGVAKRIAEAHGRNFKSMYLNTVRAFDGATKIVKRTADAGLKIVLASSAKQDELDHYVELLGISDLVAATTSIDDVESSKPKPDIFGTALEKAGVAADRAIVVGDTIYDVEAARRAGIQAIGLTSGPFDECALKDTGAVAVYADVADLLSNFERSPLAITSMCLRSRSRLFC